MILKNEKVFIHCIININDLDFDNILLDEKSYGPFLIHDVACKITGGVKPLRINFDRWIY